MSTRIQRALISVSDKTGLAEFARGLHRVGIEIFSTGGTARNLMEADVPVRDVAVYTGFPEMMDGRLKTLHPKVFGGILCRHDRDDDMQSIAQHGILPFELVVVNLYPFVATVAREGVTMAEAIEKIDIGGPSLVRAAAKNHAHVTIATRPDQYAEILAAVQQNRSTTREMRQQLAAEAFAHTAGYDQAISRYFAQQTAGGDYPEGDYPETVTIDLRRKAMLRYGENPHQRAALYALGTAAGADLVSARQLNGKELSYNNLLDADSALAIARSLPGPAVVVVKHNNPCGAAAADSVAEATRRAMEGDPVSAFGSILGYNRPVDAASAEYLATPGLFVEAIVAPEFAPEAVEILTTRPKWKTNVRLLAVGSLDTPPEATDYRRIAGGMLVQDADCRRDDDSEWKVVTEKSPTEDQMAELRFAWAIVRHVKSNAIALCREQSLCGAGAGQMSRVDSVQIAIQKAGERGRGCVLASDAFFPFPDSIQEAAQAGVTAVIQPGGSRRDAEVIAACNEYGLPMVFTGRRHFKH